ncbi:LytR/AlgR family response regulator transcription factor [Rufibacter latericius]|uniref:LytTR family transcriptional regulator n=1 Tax=Rufibacter latericius TaxID=2487040 RepID=A0A3M9MDJ4_9BACT|nr:LytTR family DNA-binding domain-containing protein [Rufibacter latericius]RNI23574.1 LytTR family transcriptional regulator [Rufibacter latericius]
MLSFFRQPYPLSELTLPKSVFHSLLFGSIIAFSLIVFQPFGSYNWHHPSKNPILAGYGVVAAISVFLNFYAFRRMLPWLFREPSWNVGKEIAWNLIHFVTGGFLCTVYGSLTGVMPFTLNQILYMSMVAFLMGLVPAVLLVLINYVYLLRKYRPLTPADKEDTPAPVASSVPDELVLVAENEKDTLRLPARELLFIEASDNYCTVFWVKEGKPTKTLLRSSLSRLENQITSPGISRCHRSYLVNLERVQTVSGNAQGYKLHFEGLDLVVPVARSYSGLVRETFVAA